MSLTVCSNGADYGKLQRQPDKIGALSRVLFYSQHQLFILFQSRLRIFFHVASSISINKNKTSHPCLVGYHFLILDNEKNTESFLSIVTSGLEIQPRVQSNWDAQFPMNSVLNSQALHDWQISYLLQGGQASKHPLASGPSNP